MHVSTRLYSERGETTTRRGVMPHSEWPTQRVGLANIRLDGFNMVFKPTIGGVENEGER